MDLPVNTAGLSTAFDPASGIRDNVLRTSSSKDEGQRKP